MPLPELRIDARTQWIRVPSELDVPVTDRVKAILDSTAMRRLARISQLGLVSFVYPGASHSRFEHSLGVYRLAVQVLSSLYNDPQIAENFTEDQAKVFLVAALVHDVGHWPYCHPMEDMRTDWIPKHEQLAQRFLCQGELSDAIANLWQINPDNVASFLAGSTDSIHSPLLQSLLSGPIDVDKMDYLQRDSLHAGVPYGRNFDIGRLIHSLCAGPGGRRIAITEKGKTAAEMMVFARYVMFSEVYWHHAVRSATAMLQRSVHEIQRTYSADLVAELLSPVACLRYSESEFAERLLRHSRDDGIVAKLVNGLFGPQRLLYKRLAQFNFAESAEVHSKFSHRPYAELVRFSDQLAQRLSSYTDGGLQPGDVLIDAPPVKLEVQFDLDVRLRSSDSHTPDNFEYRSLASISPVVRSLATEQFDKFVKRVRVFIAPDIAPRLNIRPGQLADELLDLE